MPAATYPKTSICSNPELRKRREQLMTRFDGKVAFITGAARGQGRSHAVKLAQDGADIIAVDLCAQIESVHYPMSAPADLAETVRLVEALDRRIIAAEVDVRDSAALRSFLDSAVAELGRLDIVSANAGIATYGSVTEMGDAQWRDVIDTNLDGVWYTASAAIPHLIAGQRGGSIVITSSAAGLRAYENMVHYVTAKHGLVGMVRSLALELAPHMIRVNSIHPTTVNTYMFNNDLTYAVFGPDMNQEQRTVENLKDRFTTINALPIPWVEPEDISNALAFLASDDARYITGVALPVDAGSTLK
jgi:(+)-trans-carveol dehydrogenase